MLMVFKPAADARATRSAGGNRPSDAVVCRWRSITREAQWSDAGARARLGPGFVTTCALATDERPVLTNEHLEMDALFLGKLQEDLLAFGVFEALAVALEEAVRCPLAANANPQRLAIVDAVTAKLIGAGGEQAIGRPLEKQ